jgi:hypothetical protein
MLVAGVLLWRQRVRAVHGRFVLMHPLAPRGLTLGVPASFELSTTEVGDFIVSDILAELPGYYAHVLTSTAPWMAYSKPLQWGSVSAHASAAQRLSHFDPSSPIVSYSDNEAYTMKVGLMPDAPVHLLTLDVPGRRHQPVVRVHRPPRPRRHVAAHRRRPTSGRAWRVRHRGVGAQHHQGGLSWCIWLI